MHTRRKVGLGSTHGLHNAYWHPGDCLLHYRHTVDLKVKTSNVQYELATACGWWKQHNKLASFVEGQMDAMKVRPLMSMFAREMAVTTFGAPTQSIMYPAVWTWAGVLPWRA